MTDKMEVTDVIELIKHFEKVTGRKFEFDSLKISDEERRKRFGARIRIIRKAWGLTQVDFTKKVGLTQSVITSYETGRVEPTAKNLIKLARALNVTVDWLIGTDPLSQISKEELVDIIKQYLPLFTGIDLKGAKIEHIRFESIAENHGTGAKTSNDSRRFATLP